MKVEFAPEEAWDMLNHVVARVLDEAGLSDADKAKVRRWKSEEMRVTSQEMRVLAEKVNSDLQKVMERKTKSQIRKPDWR
jgi:hypothetical protein